MNQFSLTKLNLSTNKLKFGCSLIFLIFIITIIVIGFFNPRDPIREEKFDYKDFTLLSKDTCNIVTVDQKYERLNYLSNIVLMYQEAYSNIQLSKSNERIQTRLSFVALLAVLLIPFLNKKFEKKGIIVLTIILISIPIYLYDVHHADLMERDSRIKVVWDLTIEDINNITESDYSWYDLNFKKLESFAKNYKQGYFGRKLNNALCHAEISQIAFYLVPLMTLLILYICMLKKNNLFL